LTTTILITVKELISIESVHGKFRGIKEFDFDSTPLEYLSFDWNFKGTSIPFEVEIGKSLKNERVVLVNSVNSISNDFILSDNHKILFKILEKIGNVSEMYTIVNFEMSDMKKLDFFKNSYWRKEKNLSLTFIVSHWTCSNSTT